MKAVEYIGEAMRVSFLNTHFEGAWGDTTHLRRSVGCRRALPPSPMVGTLARVAHTSILYFCPILHARHVGRA